MDPLTAAIQLAGKIVDAWTAIYAAASPETKTKVADQFYQDMQDWRAFFEKLAPKA